MISEMRVLPRETIVCPTNGKQGQLVDTQIVKAMLAVSLTEVRDTKYYFCREADCPTVYYSADGIQTFAESDLRERVYQKHPSDSHVLVCYCFQHSIQDILDGGKSVYEEIDQGVRKGQCACDIRNPQGNCCLGNVNKLVKKIQTVQ